MGYGITHYIMRRSGFNKDILKKMLGKNGVDVPVVAERSIQNGRGRRGTASMLCSVQKIHDNGNDVGHIGILCRFFL